MSNLAVHLLRTHGRPGDYELMRTVSRKLIKSVHSELKPDYNGVKQVWDCLDPDGYLILRSHPLSEDKDAMVADPEGVGKRQAEFWAEWLDGAPFVDHQRVLFEGINEFPMWVHGDTVYNKYLVNYMDQLTRHGLRGCVGHFNVGWPANSGGDSPTNWAPYHEVIARLNWTGHWIGLHEYFGFGGSEDPANGMAGWWAFRYRHLIDYCREKRLSFPPIVITELGMCKDSQGPDGNWSLDPVDGWMGHVDPELAFGHYKYYANKAKQDGVIAATIFTTDAGHPWIERFDTEGFHKFWVQSEPQSLGRAPQTDTQRPVAPAVPRRPAEPQRPVEPSTEPPAETLAAHVPTDHGSIFWPPVPGPITERFGEDPEFYKSLGIPGHDGVDFGCAEGTDVHCVADGIVAWVDTDKDYGNYIRVWHPGLRCHSMYAHLSYMGAVVNSQVKAGDVIGRSGSTGLSTGPHLHVEIRLADAEGNYVDSPTHYPRGRVDPLTFVEALKRA